MNNWLPNTGNSVIQRGAKPLKNQQDAVPAFAASETLSVAFVRGPDDVLVELVEMPSVLAAAAAIRTETTKTRDMSFRIYSYILRDG